MKNNHYANRVASMIREKTGLCIGLDPSRELLHSWGSTDDLSGLKLFCERMRKVCIQSDIAFVKPQSAFFERFGWQGLQALTELNQALRTAGIFTILDCKRGDISSTAAAYADAYLSATNYCKYDAITVNPFLGFSSHQPYIDMIKQQAVGIFVVLRSSNPDASPIQQAMVDQNTSVANWLAAQICQQNAAISGTGNLGAIGAVVGATIDAPDTLLQNMRTSFFLCPGIGAQGASIASVKQTFGNYLKQCIFPVSRGISLDTPSEEGLLHKITKMKNKMKRMLQKL